MNNIAIICNTLNKELCEKSKEFYKNTKYDKIDIPGKNKMFGWKFLNFITYNLNYEWVILIDEDCFITDFSIVDELLQYQIKNNIYCSGVPDGGVLNTRKHNPISINPFFSILNLKEIKKIYNKNDAELLFKQPDKFKNKTPFELLKSDYKFDSFEKYYGYFFQLISKNLKILYLDGGDFYKKNDIWTSTIKFNNKIFAYHTWKARFYDKEKNRIDNIYKLCKKIAK
jgi:hypothetical protein